MFCQSLGVKLGAFPLSVTPWGVSLSKALAFLAKAESLQNTLAYFLSEHLRQRKNFMALTNGQTKARITQQGKEESLPTVSPPLQNKIDRL